MTTASTRIVYILLYLNLWFIASQVNISSIFVEILRAKYRSKKRSTLFVLPLEIILKILKRKKVAFCDVLPNFKLYLIIINVF